MGRPRKETTPQPIFSEDDADLRDIWWWIGGKQKYHVSHIGRYGKTVRAHRIVAKRISGRDLTKYDIVDHVNGDTSDNRRENIRVVDRFGNAQNRHDCGGFRGAYRSGKKWMGMVFHKKKFHYLGMFEDRHDAALAAKKKRDELGFLDSTPITPCTQRPA